MNPIRIEPTDVALCLGYQRQIYKDTGPRKVSTEEFENHI